MVCAPRRVRGLERKASGWILSHSSRSSNKSPLSRAAFCVQSANRQPQIISHNSLLQKQETLESPDGCEGAYMTESETEREAQAGFCVFLSSSPVILHVAEHSEVICVFSAPLLRKRLLFIQTPFSQKPQQKGKHLTNFTKPDNEVCVDLSTFFRRLQFRHEIPQFFFLSILDFSICRTYACECVCMPLSILCC